MKSKPFTKKEHAAARKRAKEVEKMEPEFLERLSTTLESEEKIRKDLKIYQDLYYNVWRKNKTFMKKYVKALEARKLLKTHKAGELLWECVEKAPEDPKYQTSLIFFCKSELGMKDVPDGITVTGNSAKKVNFNIEFDESLKDLKKKGS